MSQKTREQRIVATLSVHDLARNGRALALPVMLIRHGLLQVTTFLKGKDSLEDRHLLAWLHAGMTAVLLPDGADADRHAALRDELTPEGLASVTLGRYLLLQEVAIEAASWLKRLVEARQQPVVEAQPK